VLWFFPIANLTYEKRFYFNDKLLMLEIMSMFFLKLIEKHYGFVNIDLKFAS